MRRLALPISTVLFFVSLELLELLSRPSIGVGPLLLFALFLVLLISTPSSDLILLITAVLYQDTRVRVELNWHAQHAFQILNVYTLLGTSVSDLINLGGAHIELEVLHVLLAVEHIFKGSLNA